MSKLKTSQIIMLSILVVLLFVSPLISPSSRPKYLYFIINLLIIALGAESGLISAFSKPLEHKNHAVPITTKPPAMIGTAPEAFSTTGTETKEDPAVKAQVIGKCASEKKMDHKVKKCPSMPSLFFIGGGDHMSTEVVEDHLSLTEEHESAEEDQEVGRISGQELFTKAETFISNFYKQLKIQREESWKRIHGFYHKAF